MADEQRDSDEPKSSGNPSGSEHPDDDGREAAAAESLADSNPGDGPGEEGAEGPLSDRAGEVARALGLDEDDVAEAEDDAPDEPKNRAERRKKEALHRRGGAKAAAGKLPAKDRNARRREELLKRRRASATAEDDDGQEAQKLEGLDATEMMEDALARGSASAIKWVQRNWGVLQWAIVATILGGIGATVFVYRSDKATIEESTALAKGLAAEGAVVIAPDDDKRTEDQKKRDLRIVHPSVEKRQDAALGEYQTVIDHGGDKPVGTLGSLGKAGVLLERRAFDEALKAYDRVLSSSLAGLDEDVKARALEGKAFALEAKGDNAAALETFKAIGSLKTPGLKALSLYHRGRVQALDKGKAEEAKKLLSEARDAVQMARIAAQGDKPAGPPNPLMRAPFQWLERKIEDRLKELDPKAAAKRQLPPELRQKLKEAGLSGALDGQAIPAAPKPSSEPKAAGDTSAPSPSTAPTSSAATTAGDKPKPAGSTLPAGDTKP